jgi:hypothetical protein
LILKIPSGAVLLIDVDGKLPNPALMKLNRYYKEKGRKVSDLRTLLEDGKRRKLILLDDNLLSHPLADDFLDDDVRKVGRCLDELVGILFPQNMKSMEKYYRWISRQYAEKFGKFHSELGNTIFRYNCRDKK